ncbi:ABC transporter substrate-binding protein [Candidatus Synechococcus spongiarum]|uniref:ABC transporter substrate-binding protein n=1 Tax=Candidatus Synechococcus spongiarum TaxID=431041 RepID=UPI0004B37336|nr:ABC transporter substrate-binding protein [Candidatus Synechococcus spongiarum]
MAKREQPWPLLLAVLLGVGATACAPTRAPDHLVVGVKGAISALDPAKAYQTRPLQLIRVLGDPLYALSETGELIPRLAAAPPQVSADGLRVTVTLRDGVRFHDDSPLDAEAMAFSLQRFRDGGGSLSYLLDDVESITVTGPLELELELRKPYTPFRNLLSFAGLTPVPASAYEPCPVDGSAETEAANELCLPADGFVGTGPYRLVSRSADGTQHRLERFDGYWGEPARSARLDLVSLENSTALFGALKNGEVDVLLSSSLEAEHQLELEKEAAAGRLATASSPPQTIEVLALATDRPPLDQVMVRQALAHALPRSLLSERASKGLNTPLRSLIPDLFPAAQPTWPGLDIEQARQLLTTAGYCQGNPLAVKFTYRANVPTDGLLALTWQEFLAEKLGDCLAMEIDGLESTTVYDQLDKGAFTMVMYNWAPDFLDPENYLRPMIGCDEHKGSVCTKGDAVYGGVFWFDHEADRLLADQQNQPPDQRQETLMALQERIAAGVPYIPIWQGRNRAWSQASVTGLGYDGSGWLRLEALGR